MLYKSPQKLLLLCFLEPHNLEENAVSAAEFSGTLEEGGGGDDHCHTVLVSCWFWDTYSGGCGQEIASHLSVAVLRLPAWCIK